MNVHSPVPVSDTSYPALALAPASERVRRLSLAEADERPMRVLVVHGHDVVRSGFRLLLSQLPWVRRCVGARTAEEAITLWNRYEPHVALVDLFVGDTAGTDLCARLRHLRSHGYVLLMSSNERVSASTAAAVGASGFISTGAPAEEIVRAIRTAGSGKTISPAPPMSLNLLSARQREVLRLMASGATNREIADALFLSPHTVKGHTADLYRRLKVRNRAEAVRRAQRVGLLV
jgi:DNA-binding NarL/FixJ family response regulator